MFLEMWEKQRVLMEKFDLIEKANNQYQIPEGRVFNIDCRFSQARLKDFSSRIAIEMAEATQALEKVINNEGTVAELYTEMADVYHFFLEMLIIADVPLSSIFFEEEQSLERLFGMARDSSGFMGEVDYSMIKYWAYEVLENLFLAMNELKAKPWKHTTKPTNVGCFTDLLCDAHFDFISMCVECGMTAKDLYESYFDKSVINEQRISNVSYH